MVQSINGTTPLDDARGVLAATYDLKFTKAVAKVTSRVYDRLKPRISEADWARLAPLIVQINRLKADKNASIFAHIQQAPEIFYGVADKAGDNLALLQATTRTRSSVVIVAGVITMAENLRLFLKSKTVLIPDSRVRSSLGASITPDDVQAIRSQYPGVQVLAHVNTSLAVKALADMCFTSANAEAVVQTIGGDKVIMVPDQFIAQNVAARTNKKIITWAGSCDVHSSFEADEVAALRMAHPDAKIIAHPQNRPAVAAGADFMGSSAAIAKWLESEKPKQAILLSAGAVPDNLAAAAPETVFLPARDAPRPEGGTTLEGILWSLHTMTTEVTVLPELAKRARAPIQKMLDLAKKAE